MNLLADIRDSGHLGEIKAKSEDIVALMQRSATAPNGEAFDMLWELIDKMTLDLIHKYPFLKGYGIPQIRLTLADIDQREDVVDIESYRNGKVEKLYHNIDPRTLRVCNGHIWFGHAYYKGMERYRLEMEDADLKVGEYA